MPNFPKDLPNRHHVVITHKEKDLFPADVEVMSSFEEAYLKYRNSEEEIFIIGGGVSKAGSFLLDRVQSYFVKYAWPGIRGIKFALAELGNDAGIYGAAQLLLSEA